MCKCQSETYMAPPLSAPSEVQTARMTAQAMTSMVSTHKGDSRADIAEMNMRSIAAAAQRLKEAGGGRTSIPLIGTSVFDPIRFVLVSVEDSAYADGDVFPLSPLLPTRG